MSVTKMNCPNCNSPLQIPDEYIGRRVSCPNCRARFEPGSLESRTNPSVQDMSETKSCPACGQTNKAAAIKCKFCNTMLTNDALPATENIIQPPSVPTHRIPTSLRQYIGEGESVRYISNPSVAALVITMIAACLPLSLVSVASFFEDYVAGILTVFIVLILALVCYLSWKHCFYVITDKRTLISEGIFNISVRIIPNRSIQMICINTGIIDRLLGLNTIEVSSAAQGGMNILSVLAGRSKGCIRMKYVNNVAAILQLYGM